MVAVAHAEKRPPTGKKVSKSGILAFLLGKNPGIIRSSLRIL
jgi:hypothetical protein